MYEIWIYVSYKHGDDSVLEGVSQDGEAGGHTGGGGNTL